LCLALAIELTGFACAQKSFVQRDKKLRKHGLNERV
jgi:hypothetical protein